MKTKISVPKRNLAQSLLEIQQQVLDLTMNFPLFRERSNKWVLLQFAQWSLVTLKEEVAFSLAFVWFSSLIRNTCVLHTA